MFSIKPIQEKYFSCFHVAVATFLHHYDRNYYMLFPDCWGFDYEIDNNMLIGERINPSWYSDFDEMNLYSGVILEKLFINSFDEFTDVLKAGASNDVYLVNCDAFDCEWGVSYNKYHVDHYFIIFGINKNRNTVNITDSFFSNEIIQIDIEKLYKIQRNVQKMSLKLNTKNKTLYELISNVYNKMHEEKDGYNSFGKLILFASDLKNTNIEKEFIYKDIYMIPLYKNLFKLEAGRYNFCKILCCFNIDTDIINEINNVIDKWFKTRMNINRIYLDPKNRNLINRVSDNLIEISLIEKSILYSLKNKIS